MRWTWIIGRKSLLLKSKRTNSDIKNSWSTWLSRRWLLENRTSGVKRLDCCSTMTSQCTLRSRSSVLRIRSRTCACISRRNAISWILQRSSNRFANNWGRTRNSSRLWPRKNLRKRSCKRKSWGKARSSWRSNKYSRREKKSWIRKNSQRKKNSPRKKNYPRKKKQLRNELCTC